MDKILFIYRGPHPVHKAFGRALGAEFLYFRPPFFNPATLLRALSRIVRPTSIVLCEETSSLPLAYLAKKVHKSKIILWGGDSLFYGLSFLKRLSIYPFLKKIDGFLAPSKYIESYAREILDCPVEVAYPFVVNAKKYLSVKANLSSKNICFLGTYSPRKGIERLISAFEIVRKEHPSSELYLVGDIPKRFQGPKIVVTGRVPDPAKYFTKCSLYVHPAIYEPFGTTVIEATMAGLVPIVSKDTGSSEFLDRELIVDGSPESIAEKVLELFSKPVSYLKKISRTQKARIMREGFDKERKIKEFKEKFYALLR